VNTPAVPYRNLGIQECLSVRSEWGAQRAIIKLISNIVSVMDYAFEHGITLFDTAEAYGQGHPNA